MVLAWILLLTSASFATASTSTCAKYIADAVLKNASNWSMELLKELLLDPECSIQCEEQQGLGKGQLAAAIAVPVAALGLLAVTAGVCAMTGRNKEPTCDPDAPKRPRLLDAAQCLFPWNWRSGPAGSEDEGSDDDGSSTRDPFDLAPGVGPYTTLMLSDVQNSTSLWEMFPTDLMDKVMSLHDECFRSLLGKHKGYESATEGDAMILAFQNPSSALRYAVEVQVALTEVQWPSQLLISPDTRAVHIMLEPEMPEDKVVKVVGKHNKVWLPSMASLLEDGGMLRPHAGGASPSGTVGHLRRQASNTSQGASSDVIGWDGEVECEQDPAMILRLGLDGVAAGYASTPGHTSSTGARGPSATLSAWAAAASSRVGNSPAVESGATLAFPGTDLSVLVPLDCNLWGKALGIALPRVREATAQKAGPNASMVIFRGLRVRMGIHTGVENVEDVTFEPVSGRIIYTGGPLDTARAVCDAAPGGGILLSAEAFIRLPHSALAPVQQLDKLINGGAVLPITAPPGSRSDTQATTGAGDRRGRSLDIRKADPRNKSFADMHGRARGAGTNDAINATIVFVGDMAMDKLSGQQLSLYMAVPSSMPGRLPWLNQPRNVKLKSWGTLAAPVGTITVAFLNVVNAAVLLTELPGPARTGINLFQAAATSLLLPLGGYAVEVVDGLILAAFPHPAAALVWGLRCNKAMSQLAWPDELLAHDMCREQVGTVPAPWEGSWEEVCTDGALGMPRLTVGGSVSNAWVGMMPDGGGYSTNVTGTSVVVGHNHSGTYQTDFLTNSTPTPVPAPATLTGTAATAASSSANVSQELSLQGQRALVMSAAQPLGEGYENTAVCNAPWWEHERCVRGGAPLGEGAERGEGRENAPSTSRPHGSAGSTGVGLTASGAAGPAAGLAVIEAPVWKGTQGQAQLSEVGGITPSTYRHSGGAADQPQMGELSSQVVAASPDVGCDTHTGSLSSTQAQASDNSPARIVVPRDSFKPHGSCDKPGRDDSQDNAAAELHVMRSGGSAHMPHNPHVAGAVSQQPGLMPRSLPVTNELQTVPSSTAQSQVSKLLHNVTASAVSGQSLIGMLDTPHTRGLTRGLRLKIGVDIGKAAATVVPQTGRLHYRGKVMNRAARVAARCRPGQVLATSLVWKYACHHELVTASGVCGDELGEAEMKGVPGLVELVHVFVSKAESERRAQVEAEQLAGSLLAAQTIKSCDLQRTHMQLQNTHTGGEALTTADNFSIPMSKVAQGSSAAQTIPAVPDASTPTMQASFGNPALHVQHHMPHGGGPGHGHGAWGGHKFLMSSQAGVAAAALQPHVLESHSGSDSRSRPTTILNTLSPRPSMNQPRGNLSRHHSYEQPTALTPVSSGHALSSSHALPSASSVPLALAYSSTSVPWNPTLGAGGTHATAASPHSSTVAEASPPKRQSTRYGMLELMDMGIARAPSEDMSRGELATLAPGMVELHGSRHLSQHEQPNTSCGSSTKSQLVGDRTPGDVFASAGPGAGALTVAAATAAAVHGVPNPLFVEVTPMEATQDVPSLAPHHQLHNTAYRPGVAGVPWLPTHQPTRGPPPPPPLTLPLDALKSGACFIPTSPAPPYTGGLPASPRSPVASHTMMLPPPPPAQVVAGTVTSSTTIPVLQRELGSPSHAQLHPGALSPAHSSGSLRPQLIWSGTAWIASAAGIPAQPFRRAGSALIEAQASNSGTLAVIAAGSEGGGSGRISMQPPARALLSELEPRTKSGVFTRDASGALRFMVRPRLPDAPVDQGSTSGLKGPMRTTSDVHLLPRAHMDAVPSKAGSFSALPQNAPRMRASVMRFASDTMEHSAAVVGLSPTVDSVSASAGGAHSIMDSNNSMGTLDFVGPNSSAQTAFLDALDAKPAGTGQSTAIAAGELGSITAHQTASQGQGSVGSSRLAQTQLDAACTQQVDIQRLLLS